MMERKNMYAVMKHTDIDSALSDSDKLLLSAILSKVERYRKENGKDELVAVVVEKDWPEYEPTWEAIKTRVEREENKQKLTSMFGDYGELFGYFYVVETRHGCFLLTSDAHNRSRLCSYGGYKFRILSSNDTKFQHGEVLVTNLATDFVYATRVSKEEILSCYDANRSIMNYNVAEFIQNKLIECKKTIA
ncbi:MAG: hypothetical protein RR212_05745 [Bacteroidales bacterium]